MTGQDTRAQNERTAEMLLERRVYRAGNVERTATCAWLFRAVTVLCSKPTCEVSRFIACPLAPASQASSLKVPRTLAAPASVLGAGTPYTLLLSPSHLLAPTQTRWVYPCCRLPHRVLPSQPNPACSSSPQPAVSLISQSNRAFVCQCNLLPGGREKRFLSRKR